MRLVAMFEYFVAWYGFNDELVGYEASYRGTLVNPEKVSDLMLIIPSAANTCVVSCTHVPNVEIVYIAMYTVETLKHDN
jgi:hypothetical protein